MFSVPEDLLLIINTTSLQKMKKCAITTYFTLIDLIDKIVLFNHSIEFQSNHDRGQKTFNHLNHTPQYSFY